MAESLRGAQERVAMLSADINHSQHRIKMMKEQRRDELKEVSNEAKKGADIISILSIELKEARAKVCELSEAQQKHFDVVQMNQILTKPSAEDELTQRDCGGFDKSRRQTIELVSLRRANEEWMSKRHVASECVDAERISSATARAVKALDMDFSSINPDPIPHVQMLPERSRRSPATPTGDDLRLSSENSLGTKGYGFRYSKCGEDRGRGVDSGPGYMRSRSWSSRSPPRARHTVPSVQPAATDSNVETQGHDSTARPSAESVHLITAQSCPLSDEHSKWINLITAHTLPSSLSNNIKFMADDLLFLEVKCALLLVRLKSSYADGRNRAQSLDEVHAAAARDIDYTEMELKLKQSESRNGRDVGAMKILEEVVSSLLAAPISALNIKYDWPAASTSHSFVELLPQAGTAGPTEPTRELTDPISRANEVTCQDSAERQSRYLEGKVAISQSNTNSSNSCVGANDVISSSPSAIPLHRLPDMIRELITTAARYHSKACEAEALLSPALSDLQTFRSNLRISKGELEYASSKIEEMERKSKTARESSLDVEKSLRRELECAADLAELQNRMISEAKKEVEGTALLTSIFERI